MINDDILMFENKIIVTEHVLYMLLKASLFGTQH